MTQRQTILQTGSSFKIFFNGIIVSEIENPKPESYSVPNPDASEALSFIDGIFGLGKTEDQPKEKSAAKSQDEK